MILVNEFIILKLVLISVILFIAINYFIFSQHDKNVIDKIINIKMDKLSEDDVIEIDDAENTYLNEKFKIYVTRAIIFGVGVYFIFNYLVSNNVDASQTEILPIKQSTNPFITAENRFFDNIPF